MPLTLVTGPANAAKAGEVFAAFRARLDRRPLLVVPTRADRAVYERELAAAGTLAGGRVTSFGGLVREIARRARFGTPVAGRFARERLIATAVTAARLEALGPSAAAPGFVPAAADLLAELARERVTPGRLATALAAWAGADPARRAHAGEVAAIHRRYRAALEAVGRTDEEGFAWGALDALRLAPAAWGDTPVFLYGFDDLTRPQRDAVETLAGPVGAEVWVSLPWEPRAAFAGRARTVAELRPLAERERALPAREDFYAEGSRAALHHLERRLWERPEELTLWEEPVPAGAAIGLLEAGGERAEAELVAARVARLVAGGVPPEEIALVHRAPARAAPALLAALADVGVAVAHRTEPPAGHTGLGRAVLGLLRAALVDGATAGDLLAWLRAPGLLRVPELADELELECRQGGTTDARGAAGRWEERHGPFPLDTLETLRRAAGRGAPALLAAVRAEAQRLLVAPHRRGEDGVGRGTAPVLSGAEAEDAAVFGALAAALGELEELGPGPGALDGPALADVLARVPVGLGDPARPGAVVLADPLGIRARRFRVVIVCGLNEGTFPRTARPEPFLSDADRAALAAASGLVLDRPGSALDEERHLFYACASRAAETLLLSYRTSDEEGNRELPSPFVGDVAALFTGLRVERRPLADVTWPEDEAPTPRERARARAAAAPREQPPALGDLELAEVRRLVRHSEVLSANALESYAACPVAWLVERQLEPAELAPDHDRLKRGRFIHLVLERTLRELRASTGSARVTEANRAEAERRLHAVVEEERGTLEAELPRAVARSAVRAAEADLRRFLAASARAGDLPWEPRDFELRFGFDAEDPASLPALTLGKGEDAVRVRGAIDRLDVDRKGRAIVRDYKSGRAQPGWSGPKWREAGNVQVALYMLAVRDLLGLLPAAGLYQPLRGGTDPELRPRGLVAEDEDVVAAGVFVNGDVQPPEEVDAVLDGVEADVVALARELRAGRLGPRPVTCSTRGGCRHPGICRSAAA